MNIHQTIPRSDCTSFVKCGKHFLAYCRKYSASECGPCEIARRKSRKRVMAGARWHTHGMYGKKNLKVIPQLNG